MRYLLKEDVAKKIKNTYKNKFFEEKVGICKSYTSLILNRRKSCTKIIAYCITKAIDTEAEILDFFEVA